MNSQMTIELQSTLLGAEKNEITEFYVYSNLAKQEKDPNNQKILEKIALQEKGHYLFYWL